MERFLQACAEDNIQVANCTTPAQYFHILRRQVLRQVRKPLVIMTPKKLLRFEPCRSPLRALSEDRFHEILRVDTDAPKASRLILCSGKVYYDLDAYRQKEGLTNTHIVRFEQLYPIHKAQFAHLVQDYTHVTSIIWCQEESQNMGAWTYIEPLLRKAFGREITYAGRDASSSPATGALSIHNLEQADLVHQAFTL